MYSSKRCTTETLSSLRENHAFLCAIVEKTNRAFAPILVFTTPLNFFNQLYGYYYLCIGFFDLEESVSENRWGMVAGATCWLINVTVPMVNLYWSSDCTISEAHLTKDLLLKISFLPACNELTQQVIS
jgi:hypothetical protein